jgi:septal ring factor EnvC (AmiA/AmiB activator)
VRWPSVALALLALAGMARADEHTGTEAQLPVGGDDLREYVIASLDAQLEVIARTRATVGDKLGATSAQRGRRTRAAYKLLRTGEPAWIAGDERMATARRRAAARWLLARDQREEALLAGEADALAIAEARLVADRAAAATAPLPPPELDRPVRGVIARTFGPFVHERSKATLTRRGVDFEVDDDAEVVPVADGTITYVGPIRGLDHGLIIDHGGWMSVVAKLDPPALAAGAKVVRGQVIGTPARRRVYLEIRVSIGPGGVPVDPEPFID